MYFLASSVALILVVVELTAYLTRDDAETIQFWLAELNLGHRGDAFEGGQGRLGAAPLFDHVDLHLGWAHGPRAMAERAEALGIHWMPGFTVRRHEVRGVRPANIVLLGGSTTDDMLSYTTNWPTPLYERLREAGASFVMYNGGTMGYCTQQEHLKLLRDGLDLEPDLVISYSGVNDGGQPGFLTSMYQIYLTAFGLSARQPGFMNNTKAWLAGGGPREHAVRGLTAGYGYDLGERAMEIVAELESEHSRFVSPKRYTGRNCAARWLHTWRAMAGASGAFGAEFLGVRQPVLGVGISDATPEEEAAFAAKWGPRDGRSVEFQTLVDCYAEFDAYTPKPSHVLDLVGLFKGRPREYLDGVHLSVQGNADVAARVFAELDRLGLVEKMKRGQDLRQQP